MDLHGLHHLTAVTGNPARNVWFYTEVLGMRLVKKTVNQDDVSAYHLFYGDEQGRAGTEVTFFDWPHAGPAVAGAGSVTATALRVSSEDALKDWADRLASFSIVSERFIEYSGRPGLALRDPEGQALELVAGEGGAPAGKPWALSPVPVGMGIQGLHAVHLTVRFLDPTARLLHEVLGFREEGTYTRAGNEVRVYSTEGGGPGREVHVSVQSKAPAARLGIGGVHHVAFRTPDDEQHRWWRTRLAEAGIGVTPVIDRFYFRSLYFREPGGVLFEIATDGPGFAVDEAVDRLGQGLSLPPFLEHRRASIEAGLRPIERIKQPA